MGTAAGTNSRFLLVIGSQSNETGEMVLSRPRQKLAVAFAFGWRSGSPLRLFIVFEYGFSRCGRGSGALN